MAPPAGSGHWASNRRATASVRGSSFVGEVAATVAECRQRSSCVLVMYWTQRSILAPVSARIWYRKVRHLGSRI